MNQKEIINKLNWFYSLEINQVDLYTVQSKNVKDIYIKKVLERVTVIEQEHVDNISKKIKELGGKPTLLGEMVAPITGTIAGTISTWAGVIEILKIDIKLEQKAMADYKDFILKVGDEDIFKLLWSNLIDEDLHTAWFANKVKELETLGR